VEGGGGGLTVSGVTRNHGGFVKCVAIQKSLRTPAVEDKRINPSATFLVFQKILISVVHPVSICISYLVAFHSFVLCDHTFIERITYRRPTN
jgi:hypothetical protein